MQNPRIVRMNADYEKLKRLEKESGGSLRIIRASGAPPKEYILELKCPSLAKKPSNLKSLNECLTYKHEIAILLGTDYPMKMPTAKVLTPIFNPHVFSHGGICLGQWSPAESLDLLVIRIGALLQLDPRVLDSKSPANNEADSWLKQNQIKLPLGNVIFQSPNSDQKIKWMG